MTAEKINISTEVTKKTLKITSNLPPARTFQGHIMQQRKPRPTSQTLQASVSMLNVHVCDSPRLVMLHLNKQFHLDK